MGKFGAIRTVRQEPPASRVEEIKATSAPVAQPISLSMRGRPAGKRSNPDFEPTTVFLRKSTKKTVNRTLEDAEVQQDLSELIETLLQQWISARL